MPAIESVCAAFAAVGSPEFYAITPTAAALDATWASAGGAHRAFSVEVAEIRPQPHAVRTWLGQVSFDLKPKAVKKPEGAYLHEVLRALHAGAGDLVPPDPVAAGGERNKFAVQLEHADGRARLRVTIRAAGLCYADIPLQASTARWQTR